MAKKVSIFSLLTPYRGLIILLIFFTLLASGINLLLPWLISHGIDSYNNGTFDQNRILWQFGLAVGAIFFINYLLSIVQTFTSERVARDLRTQLAAKISEQSYAFVEQTNPSKLLTNLTADTDSIKMFISQAIVNIVSSVFVILGAAILLLRMNWKLALCVIAIIPVIGVAFFIVLKKVRAIFIKSRAVVDWLNKVINETIVGAALVRVVNSQQMESTKFLAANSQARDYGLHVLRLFAFLIPIISFTASLAGLSILVLGGHFVIQGSMSLGDFAAFNSYLAMLVFPILVIGFMSNVIAQATASFERIRAVIEAPPPQVSGTRADGLKGKIEVRDITLNYGQKPVLRQVSFNVSPGSKTAILGPTAAGKTQLLYLLTGLTLPTGGEILFDDYPIASYDPEYFHNRVGFVFQDSIIFNMSVRENIAFSQVVQPEDMQLAIRAAELSDFVDSLNEKMDTVVSERGSSLSGGQKQRIMLARALALKPSILFLDDFTARVDNQTERRILANIQEYYPSLTLISVTQKIAAVEHYDQILLLMEGELIASGRHDDLITTSPEYAQLFQSQQSTSNYEL